MPDLPTITVTQAQADRILEAYKVKYGVATTQEAIVRYKQWLANEVKRVVKDIEKAPLRSTFDTQVTNLAGDIDNNLLPPV